MSRIKVYQYLTTLNDGGAETIVKDYCTLLDKNKFDVRVIVLWLFGDSANLRSLKSHGIKIERVFKYPLLVNRIILKIASLWPWYNKYIYSSFIPRRLKSIISKEKPDVIHSHLEVLQTLSPLSDFLGGIKLFYTCHSLPKNFLGYIRPREADAAKELVSKGMKIIALHDQMANEINEMFGINSTLVIKNGICLSRYRDIIESKEDIRASINIHKDAFVIGHVGRFAVVKNHTFLLDVFEAVKKIKIESKLLLVGSGELEDEVRSKIKSLNLESDVIILSHRNDVNRLLKAMDCFVFPSHYEGFGIVLIEAQAAGLRCIVSDSISSTTYVSKNITPIPLENGVEAWAKEIITPKASSKALYDINIYDISNEIIKLETMYSK